MQNWDVPKSLEGIWKFFDTISQRESWKNTYYTEKCAPVLLLLTM